jgi:dihydrofolate reductase (trimethoprim resistance protein)
MIFKHDFKTVSAAVDYLGEMEFPYTREMQTIMFLETKGINDHTVTIEMDVEEEASSLPLRNKTFKSVCITYGHMVNWEEKEYVTNSRNFIPVAGAGESSISWRGWSCFSVANFKDIPLYGTMYRNGLIVLGKDIQAVLEGAFSSEDPPRPIPAHTEHESDNFAGKFKTFKLGDLVTKKSGSKWTGRVVGFYSTVLTPEGYAVESLTEVGSVQIYPAHALIEKAF